MATPPSVAPWALSADLEARWRPLTEEERRRATVLLLDAQSLVMDECPRWESSTVATRVRVVCAVVKRAMSGPVEGLVGVSATTETTGPFSQQVTFANPAGDLYLTKAERRAVGGARVRAREFDLLTHPGGDGP
jgi:hypothetical protein